MAEIGIIFKEKLSGYIAKGERDFHEGAREDRGKRCSFKVSIEIPSFKRFLNLSSREAVVKGTFSHEDLGSDLKILNGVFTLFQVDPKTGETRIEYRFSFYGTDGVLYTFLGYKVIEDDFGLDILEDLTTLYSRIYRGDPAEGLLWGSGIVKFKLTDLPSMLKTFKVTGTDNFCQIMLTKGKFLSLVYGRLRKEYMRKLTAFYWTGYENLVLRGSILSSDGAEGEFFLISGIHDKDFPWGDGYAFWDILLFININGVIRKFALSKWRIPGLLLRVEDGTYQFDGDIFEVLRGETLFITQMLSNNIPDNLSPKKVQMRLSFKCKSCPSLEIPFQVKESTNNSSSEKDKPEVKIIPAFIGVRITPNLVYDVRGHIKIENETLEIVSNKTRGEAEISSWCNPRWPTISYRYLLGIRNENSPMYLQINTDILRANRRDPLKDRVIKLMGGVLEILSRRSMKIDDEGCVEEVGHADVFPLSDELSTILEIRNDHYPTGTLVRRLFLKKDGEGHTIMGLEERSDSVRLGPINSDKKALVVVEKGDDDKFSALEKVLEKTGFFDLVEQKMESLGKSKEEFLIFIKTNLMFAYSRKDPTTLTDPELVEYLVKLLKDKGFQRIMVGDARSTYGVFFKNREVRNVARYFGYKWEENGYDFVDLSEDTEEYMFGPFLGRHFVNRKWKDADFRISFAKNKTHNYAVYTLCIKNIYGALPLEDKFKEYHVNRDIVNTTMEFLEAFPVHFGLIDAFISADGPFGIFADRTPSHTKTIIGGEDIIAVDWIGATKMGLDPMVSPYMVEAVKRFGKPMILLDGDADVYPNWENVTPILSKAAFGIMDKNYTFGNLFYSVFSTMDPYFAYKDKGWIRHILRVLNRPLRAIFFEGLHEGKLDKELTRKLYMLLTLDREDGKDE